jgi:hypothetical protein
MPVSSGRTILNAAATLAAAHDLAMLANESAGKAARDGFQ